MNQFPSNIDPIFYFQSKHFGDKVLTKLKLINMLPEHFDDKVMTLSNFWVKSYSLSLKCF